MKIRNRVLSLALSFALLLTCIPLTAAYAEDDLTIRSLEFTIGVPEPKAGEEIPELDEDNQNPVEASVGSENCTVECAFWNNNDYDFSMEAAASGAFTDNRNYYLVIVLYADDGYVFSKNIENITVNGEKGTGSCTLNPLCSMLLYVQKYTLGEPKDITVTFDSNGKGTAPQALTAQPGQMLYEVLSFEDDCNLYYEDGYQFYDWSTDSDNDPEKAVDYFEKALDYAKSTNKNTIYIDPEITNEPYIYIYAKENYEFKKYNKNIIRTNNKIYIIKVPKEITNDSLYITKKYNKNSNYKQIGDIYIIGN